MAEIEHRPHHHQSSIAWA